MRITPKRAIKAILPYGLVILLKRYKLNAREVSNNYSQQTEANKKFDDLLITAKTISKNDQPSVIISLTSYGHRIQQTAPLSIVSLFNQTVLPDKIILWLAYGEKTSRRLDKLKKHGLEVRYTKDTRSYKKLIPTLKEYPQSAIITVDDDMLYPENWLENTLKTRDNNQGMIVVHRAKKIVFKNKKIAPYTNWPLLTDNKVSSHLILPTGAGGVLYPPNSLDNRVSNEALFTKLAPHADDLWFWAMAELKNTKRVLVNNGFRNTINYELDNSNENRLSIINVDPENKNNNDAQFAKILQKFPELHKGIVRATKQINRR